MTVYEINLMNCQRYDVTINEYLLLAKFRMMIKNPKSDIFFSFNHTPDDYNNLIKKGLIKEYNREIIITKAGGRILDELIIEDINFDDIFFSYPYKTPSGRILRTKDSGNTRGLFASYELVKRSYLSKVKTKEHHDEVVLQVKNMVKDYEDRGSIEYLPEFTRMVNKKLWEAYEPVEKEEKVESFMRKI